MEKKRKRSGATEIALTLFSFAYKNGIPEGCLYYADLRALENPAWKIRDYKTKTGVDGDVKAFVFKSARAQKKYADILGSLKRLQEVANGALKVGIGCKSGQHRSVAFVEKLSAEASLNVTNVLHLEQSKVQGIARLPTFRCACCGIKPKGCNEMNIHLLGKKHSKKQAKLRKRRGRLNPGETS